MMTLTYIIAALILLGLCIFVHELGHLLGGMLVGIKARVFSMGYGKGFIKKKIGETTYQVTLIPIGGYCQFYGDEPGEEREGKDYEFLSAAPWRRIVTVAMGPIFNLIFGILLFFMMNLVGYEKETNRIIIPERLKSGDYISAAHKAGMKSGDRIVRIDDKKIAGFSDIQSKVIFSEGKTLSVTVERKNKKIDLSVVPQTSGKSTRYSIGVIPYGTKVMLGGVVEGDVAEKAGLRQLDEIISIDGKKINSGEEFTDIIKKKANREVTLKISRKGKESDIKIIPRVNEVVTIDGKVVLDITMVKKGIAKKSLMLNGTPVINADVFKKSLSDNRGKSVEIEYRGNKIKGVPGIENRGFMGVYPVISPEMVDVSYGPGEGLVQAFVEPYEFIVLNLKGIGMLFTGKVNVRENLSGPIRIAKIAGDVAYYKGISAFIILMAKISIILMVMNFLPIPVVDGGHLVFYFIEALRGKPLNEKLMERIQTVGVVVLIMLGVFVIINDIIMLPIFQKLFN
jgi:regulator of sigma E protease